MGFFRTSPGGALPSSDSTSPAPVNSVLPRIGVFPPAGSAAPKAMLARTTTTHDYDKGNDMARILVLEDDDEVRSVLRVALEADGHSVIEASDGNLIEASVDEHKPDIVVTDILMEGRDGFEAIPALRRRFPELPILAVSGGGGTLDTNDILGTATTLGADATLTKPFRIATLVGAIAYLLRKNNQAGARPGA